MMARSITVTFLGTGAARPTPGRNVSAALVEHEGTRVLVDCGEGTERQLLRYAGGPFVDAVFITHAHADHILGLPGLMRTTAAQGRGPRVYAPGGAAAAVKEALDVVRDELPGAVLVHHLHAGINVGVPPLTVSTFATRHRGPSLGYVVAAGAARAVFTGDARPSEATSRAAAGADLLVHEATFCEEERARAIATGHATAAEAAFVARDARALRLVLTHVSSRYGDDPRALEQEARAIFPGAVIAQDGLEITLEVPDAANDDREPRDGVGGNDG